MKELLRFIPFFAEFYCLFFLGGHTRRLGHSDVKITWETYAHLYPKEEERAVEILNKL